MADETVIPWYLVIEFANLDLDDDDVLDKLVADASLHIQWSSTEGVTTAEATIAAESVPEALSLVFAVVHSAVPAAVAMRLVDPLVTISDIADEVGVTRQAVRNWALGTRQSGFPRPLAVVGDGVRVWRQADVAEWLNVAVGLGPGRLFPSAAFVAMFNESILAGPPPAEDEDEWHPVYSRPERPDKHT